MAAELLAGATLGALFGEAKDYVKDFVKKVKDFKPILLEFQANLNSLQPFFDVIERQDSDQILSQKMARQLRDILEEIKPVVGKCTDKKFFFWKKAKYAKKLQDLDTKLRGFFQLNGQAKLLVDNAAIWDKLKESERRFDQVMEIFLSTMEARSVTPPELPDHKIVGLEKPIEDLKKMVYVEDDSCRPLVITALPGSGKTTLATMFCNDPEIKEKFGKNIIFVTVSSKPELEYLKKLANMIKETKEDRDTLLVLDDVWPNDQESIIKLFVFEKPCYKILVTSRSSLPTLDGIRVYELEKLSEKDAEAVFRDAAKPNPKFDLDELVKKIVNHCRASPLALRVIGASLKGKSKKSWKAKVHEWSTGGSVFDFKDLRDVVVTIVDWLEAKEKECFLDLGSFPEDQRIPATALRDIWVEKYGHDEAGATTLHYLDELSTRNLINFKLSMDVSKIEGSSHDHYIQQHDLLRDLAIHCSSRDREEERTRMVTNVHGTKFPLWWEQQKNLNNAELVSISTDEDFSSEWKDLHAPKVKVLVLNSRKDYALPNFLNKMDQLRVIVITNYGFSHAQLDNTQVLTKLPNLRRIRFKSFSITSIPKMANLEKLSLIMCEVGDAFAEDMASLLPNLVEFEIDQPSDLKILPNTLCNITGLNRLGITYCQELVELPEELGKLTNLKALRLHSCTKLKELPDSLCDLQNLKHLDITDCYAMDKLPKRMGDLGSLKSLHMRCCGGRWGLPDLPTSVKNLKSLKKVICSEQTAPGWRSVEDLTSLKSIVVPEEDFIRSFSRITGQHL